MSYIEWKNWNENEFGKHTVIENSYYELEIMPFLNPTVSSPRVLEIGFGNGAFLGWCLGKSVHYIGIEAIPILRDRAQQKGVEVFSDINDLDFEIFKNSFDLIVAFNVIEHIEQKDLPEFFLKIRSLLKSAAYFIARFPNGDSPFGRMNQHGDLTHVTTLGRHKLFQLAMMAEFEVIRVAAPKLLLQRGLMKKIKRMAGNILRFCIEKPIRFLYFDNQEVVFSADYIAVLKKNDHS
ncbi:MAG: cyclopropane-fatty-acyl-phospholipid [uncultured bacterium]|nr:MAG: cyclopropane-fatty-acyl-phospholipid [uncultured bacterium]OGT24525.1 MAG: hypothetical protein A2W47_05330 [Gammaproteobacteria bacterium RIFCSPHIGHO2_12_38_15]OGT76852.1 MAG: hypothetical protein A3G71_02740 [Gammaproteobacteria bacterium RIFCSPLOWO2_12_FULL_38_14]